MAELLHEQGDGARLGYLVVGLPPYCLHGRRRLPAQSASLCGVCCSACSGACCLVHEGAAPGSSCTWVRLGHGRAAREGQQHCLVLLLCHRATICLGSTHDMCACQQMQSDASLRRAVRWQIFLNWLLGGWSISIDFCLPVLQVVEVCAL